MQFVAIILVAMLAACAPLVEPAGPTVMHSAMDDTAFTMQDGTRLPYRVWQPEAAPKAVILALHGMNGSRNTWLLPAPVFAEHGIAVYAPDQRGFGDTPTRTIWAGAESMAADATTMARLLRWRYPQVKIYAMGESMGAAVLMAATTGPAPPPVDGYILIAPAVRGRATMNGLTRGALWTLARILGPLGFYDSMPGITPTDNREALITRWNDPLTIRTTRLDTLSGLVDLMDTARDAAPRLRAPTLLVYGGRDQLVPGPSTASLLCSLPSAVRVGMYPNGYHMLLRDRQRAEPIGDIAAWIANPTAALPSGAEQQARNWLANRPGDGTNCQRSAL